MPTLNYDDYSPEVRDRIQQRLQPTASAPTVGAAPRSPTMPPASPSGPYPNDFPPPPGAGPISADPTAIETWGRGWASSGGRTNQDFQNYLAAHPLPAGYSATGNHGDRISGPNGYTRDAVLAAGLGGQGAQWLDTTQPQGAGGGAAAMPANPWIGQIRQQLLQRLQADQQPVDENAPQIAQPFQAAQLSASRSQDSERKALAEQLYGQSGGAGIDQNALTQGIQQSAERNAVGLGSLKASLIQQEYQSRRADLNEAMQQALASGDAELARQIQLVMANLDATVRREGLGVQKDISEAQLNQNAVIAGLKR